MLEQKGTRLDFIRLIMALLVIANHTSPLAVINSDADFLLSRVIARLAVPFFFMVSGYFVLARRKESKAMRSRRIKDWLIQTMKLYALAIVLYLPINYYAGQLSEGVLGWLKDVLIDGTFYHLWYFPAVITGLWLVSEMMKQMKDKTILLSCLLLYLIGLGGDSYFGLIQGTVLNTGYQKLFLLMDYTRSGFFFAPIFLYMGALVREKEIHSGGRMANLGFVICLGLMISEALTLRGLGWMRHDSMLILLVPASFFLFQIGLRPGVLRPDWRRISTLVYILHPMMILVVRSFGKIGGLRKILVENNLVLFLLTAVLSYGFSTFLIWAMEKTRPLLPEKKGRIWRKIDEAALKENVRKLTEVLPENCRMMAVIKDDAYGHGASEVGALLEKQGIQYFAVASVEEAVALRQGGLTSEILILGRTRTADFKCLAAYNLIQTVVDLDYARLLDEYSKRIRVHVAVDTGMHRLGIGYDETEAIIEVYRMKRIKAEGIYSHLACSDSLNEADVEFTREQIRRFDHVLAALKAAQIDPGLRHLQSTYGLLNYPELSYDLVRIGIGLSGCGSEKKETRLALDLAPVLSLHSRIISIRTIGAGESVSYGRQYTADSSRQIAVISAGYGDGLTRNSENLEVLVKGIRVPVIGRICMDQCMIDVTGLKVEAEEEVILIGKMKEERITAEEMAKKAGTITNEVFVHLKG